MNADNTRAWTSGNDVEDRMLAAVRTGDQVGYFAALRSAHLIVPVRQVPAAARMVARIQPQRLMFDVDGRHHLAVFTSAELAQRGVAAAFGGDGSGWSHENYDLESFVATFSDSDVPVLVNAGTPLQQAFMVSDVVGRWADAGIAPSKRRGSYKSALTFLVAAVVMFSIGFNLTGGPVTCGSQVMAVDDTCVVVSSAGMREDSYEQTRRSQNQLGYLSYAAAAGLSAATLYHVGARLAARGRRNGAG